MILYSLDYGSVNLLFLRLFQLEFRDTFSNTWLYVNFTLTYFKHAIDLYGENTELYVLVECTKI